MQLSLRTTQQHQNLSVGNQWLKVFCRAQIYVSVSGNCNSINRLPFPLSIIAITSSTAPLPLIFNPAKSRVVCAIKFVDLDLPLRLAD